MSNIMPGHIWALQMVTSGHPGVTLWNCTINGEPGVAVVLVERPNHDEFEVMPLFVAITPGMGIDFPGGHRGSGEDGEGGGPCREFAENKAMTQTPAPRPS
jgi:hypothetical protein